MASAGWFVVLTMLWPASSRPYIAGSTDNNFMNLVLGYNGFARVLGRNHPAFTPPPSHVGTMAGARCSCDAESGGGFGGFGDQSPGITRLFSGEFGFEIGWLLPAAAAGDRAGGGARGAARHAPIPSAPAAILFGGWLLVDGLVLSFMHGMIHPYYSLSIAPRRRGDVRDRRRPAVGASRIRLVPRRTRGDAAGDRGVGLVDARAQRRTGCLGCGGRSWC